MVYMSLIFFQGVQSPEQVALHASTQGERRVALRPRHGAHIMWDNEFPASGNNSGERDGSVRLLTWPRCPRSEARYLASQKVVNGMQQSAIKAIKSRQFVSAQSLAITPFPCFPNANALDSQVLQQVAVKRHLQVSRNGPHLIGLSYVRSEKDSEKSSSLSRPYRKTRRVKGSLFLAITRPVTSLHLQRLGKISLHVSLFCLILLRNGKISAVAKVMHDETKLNLYSWIFRPFKCQRNSAGLARLECSNSVVLFLVNKRKTSQRNLWNRSTERANEDDTVSLIHLKINDPLLLRTWFIQFLIRSA